MGHFGPAIPGKWWPTVMDAMNNAYFFGGISASEAVTLLEFSEPGEFLVRYSKSHGNWVISWVHQRGQVLHTPVSHHYCSEEWTVSSQSFPSIKKVIDTHKHHWKKPVVLCPPCTGIFEKGFIEQNETSGYRSLVDLDLLNSSPSVQRDDSPKEIEKTPNSKKFSKTIDGKLISSPRRSINRPSNGESSPNIHQNDDN